MLNMTYKFEFIFRKLMTAILSKNVLIKLNNSMCIAKDSAIRKRECQLYFKAQLHNYIENTILCVITNSFPYNKIGLTNFRLLSPDDLSIYCKTVFKEYDAGTTYSEQSKRNKRTNNAFKFFKTSL